MIVIESDRTKTLVARGAVKRRALAEFAAAAQAAVGLEGEVSVLLTDDARIRGLNREFRGKDEETDVLSFPAGGAGGAEGEPRASGLAGDVAISVETALRHAEEFGHGLEMELKILLLHGLLHLAGMDHEKDGGKMARRERRLRAELGLGPGLIERSVGARLAGMPVRSGSESAGSIPSAAVRSGSGRSGSGLRARAKRGLAGSRGSGAR